MARRAQPRNCCACCMASLISTGLTCLFLWLALRAQHPKCFLQSLHIPSLNTNTTTYNRHNRSRHTNNTILFQLKLANPNNYNGVQYDAVSLAFSVFVDAANTTRPLADATLAGFYQGHGKSAVKRGSAEALGGGVNRTVVAAEHGMVFVRVEFATEVKYKILSLFYTKRHRLFGGANVEVNASSGEKVGPKGIRLGNVPPRIVSEAAQVRGRRVAALLGMLVTLLFLIGFT